MSGLVLSELELERKAKCSLYVPRVPQGFTLEDCATRTFQWAVLQRHRGRLPTAQELREHFTKGWAYRWTRPKDQEYWTGPKAAPGFARRTYEFLLKFEIIQPYKAYRLELEHGAIVGENALALWTSVRRVRRRMWSTYSCVKAEGIVILTIAPWRNG